MKSPLVEVLRQASGSDAPSEQSERAVPTEPAADSSDVDDLHLMVSTGILPINDTGDLPIDGTDIAPVSGTSDTADEDADAEFYGTNSLQIANDDIEATTAPAADPAPYPPALHSGQRSGMTLLGRYSPLFCLALAAAATGFYFAYQNLSGWHWNSDLAALPGQVGSSGEQGKVQPIGADGAENRFKLIVTPRASISNDVQTDSDSVAASAIASKALELAPLSDPENLAR